MAFCVVIKNFVARSHLSDSRLNLWQSAKNFYHFYGGSRCNTYILKGRDMVGSTNDDKYLPKCEQFWNWILLRSTTVKHNQITFEAILISFWSLVFQFLAEFVSAAPYSHNWTTCLLNVIPIFCKELRRTISWWRRAGSCVQINWKPGLWLVDLSPGQPISDQWPYRLGLQLNYVSKWLMYLTYASIIDIHMIRPVK